MATKRPALGRGIDALINTSDVQVSGTSSMDEIELTKIHTNPSQPRAIFDEDALEELASSIRQVGIITPITLRKLDENNYQIIAGERRFRAAQKVGLSSIPAYIRRDEDIVDKSTLRMALIENIQRQDLNAIEMALAFKNLMDEEEITQEQLSEKVGKDRATISNHIRLLRLPAVIQNGIQSRVIDMGHARSLAGLDNPIDQKKLYELVVSEGLSVRKLEDYVRQMKMGKSLKEILNPATAKKSKSASASKAPAMDFAALRDQLAHRLKTKVQVLCSQEGKGKITIHFDDQDKLMEIIAHFDHLH